MIKIGKRLVFDALLSGFFAAIAPFFLKLTIWSKDSKPYPFFAHNSLKWAIVPWDILMIILLVGFNTISVQFKMLSYKWNGAFIGTTLIFVFTYIFSLGLDFIDPTNDTKKTPWEIGKRVIGAVLMIIGAGVVALEHSGEEDDPTKQKLNEDGDQEKQEGADSRRSSKDSEKRKEKRSSRASGVRDEQESSGRSSFSPDVTKGPISLSNKISRPVEKESLQNDNSKP